MVSAKRIAKQNGEKYYMTNKPCKHGHRAPRYTKKGDCSTCRKLYNEKRTPLKKRGARNWYITKNARSPEYMKQRREKFKREKNYILLVSRAKSRAKKRNIPFNLTTEWGKSHWTGKCELTGISFDLSYGSRKKSRYYSASLDRIDNSKGYIQDNCRIVLMAVNIFKGKATDDEMYAIAEALVAHRKSIAENDQLQMVVKND